MCLLYNQQRELRTRGMAIVIGICPILITLIYLFSPILYFSPDSYEYQSIALSMIDGSFLSVEDNSSTPFGVFHRSPLYSVFLAGLEILDGITPYSVFLLHAGLILTFSWFFLTQIRGQASIIAMGMAISLSLYSLRHGNIPHLLIVGTQVCGLMFVFGWIGFFLHFLHHRNAKSFIFLCTISVLMVLLRSAFTPILFTLMIALPFCSFRWRTRLILLGISLIPMIVWSSVNAYRFDTLALSPSLGWQLGTMGGIIGGIPVSEAHSSKEIFWKKLNQNKIPAYGEEEAFFSQLSSSYGKFLDEHYTPYTYTITAMNRIRVQENLSFITVNRWGFEYGIRSVFQNFKRYRSLVWEGLQRGSFNWSFFILWLISATHCILRKKMDHTDVVLMAMSIFHAGHIFLCSLVQLIVVDYYTLTFFPWATLYLYWLLSCYVGQQRE